MKPRDRYMPVKLWRKVDSKRVARGRDRKSGTSVPHSKSVLRIAMTSGDTSRQSGGMRLDAARRVLSTRDHQILRGNKASCHSRRVGSALESGRPLRHSRSHGIVPLMTAALFAAAAVVTGGATIAAAVERSIMQITLTSTVFENGQPIPVRHTCDGSDVSPPLEWTGVPAESRSLALICDDPDAPGGTWVHWVIYNIRPQTTGLHEKIAAIATLPSDASQSRNGFRRVGYGGPCPPPDRPHRYFFKIYALDSELAPTPGLTKDSLVRLMEGHILAEGQLMGTYRRR